MQSSQSMLKTGVICPRINKVCKTQLFNIPQPLEPRMFYEIEYKIARDAYKSINRVINNLSLVNQINQLGNFIMQK